MMMSSALAQNTLVQNTGLILNYRLEEALKGESYYIHSADRPFLQRDLILQGGDSTILSYEKDSVKAMGRFSKGHFLDVKKKWFGFKVDPSVHYEAGYSSVNGFSGDFQSGFRMQFDLGKMVSIFGDARYGSTRPLGYVEDMISRNDVIPGGDYAYKFFEVERAFEKAWLFHQHRNKHHWDYWVNSKGTAIPMPSKYVMQMIADWRGMSRKFGGTAKDYYEKNKDRLILHEKTVEIVERIIGGENV